MNYGTTYTIHITNQSTCNRCGHNNRGASFVAVYIGPIVTDFGSGKRFEPVDYFCMGCKVPIREHIEWDNAEAQRESVELLLAARGA